MIDVAISPCPNDTFIFAHLGRRGEELLGREIVLDFADVEELNRRAIEERRHRVSKMSYFAFARAREDYTLLPAGGALGRGCGPLLISGRDPGDGAEAAGTLTRVLIPGRWTTANLLTHLFLADRGREIDSIEFVPTRYDRIIPALQSGEAAYGVIIHEERFTYQKRGLFAVQDLGEWWEQTTGAPIPLGCIAVRNDVKAELQERLTQAIRASLAAARQDPAAIRDFVKQYSQELDDEVIDQHIGLYVNDFSLDVGEEGQKAIAELFARAEQAGIA